MYLDFRGFELHVWCSPAMLIGIWVGVAETFGTRFVLLVMFHAFVSSCSLVTLLFSLAKFKVATVTLSSAAGCFLGRVS